MKESEIVTDAILARRSTREGRSRKPIDRSVLERIVRCGLAAPSSKNAQPWRFHVVDDVDLLDEIANDVLEAEDVDAYVPHDPATGQPRSDMVSTVVESVGVLRDSGAAIFVENRGAFGGGRRAILDADDEARRASIVGYSLELLGIGAAIENMFLAATALDLGVAFMGDVVIAEEAISGRLRVEGDLLGVLAMAWCEPIAKRPPRHRDATDLTVWH